MKRWAAITVTLYGLFLLVLTLPVCLLCGLQWHAPEHELRWEIGFGEVMELFRNGWYWVWLFVFLAAQVLLLIVPVRAIERRPRGRRSIRLTIVTATFLLANLFFAAIFAVLAAWRGDKMFDGLEVPFAALTFLANHIPMLRAGLAQVGIPLGEELVAILNLIGLLLFFWLVWGLIFYHYAKADEPDTLVRRAMKWLLRGSILELLIAVPSHIVVRSRTECCAPFVSFWGIATGISVMLLSFGPGVLFLFARRLRERRPKAGNASGASDKMGA
jgi:hypothetical protein